MWFINQGTTFDDSPSPSRASLRDAPLSIRDLLRSMSSVATFTEAIIESPGASRIGSCLQKIVHLTPSQQRFDRHLNVVAPRREASPARSDAPEWRSRQSQSDELVFIHGLLARLLKLPTEEEKIRQKIVREESKRFDTYFSKWIDVVWLPLLKKRRADAAIQRFSNNQIFIPKSKWGPFVRNRSERTGSPCQGSSAGQKTSSEVTSRLSVTSPRPPRFPNTRHAVADPLEIEPLPPTSSRRCDAGSPLPPFDTAISDHLNGSPQDEHLVDRSISPVPSGNTPLPSHEQCDQ